MRQGTHWRQQRAFLGEILSRRHALHPVRHRSGVHVSVGGRLSRHAGRTCHAQSRARLDGFLPRHFVRRLHLRAEEKSLRLEDLNRRLTAAAFLRRAGKLTSAATWFMGRVGFERTFIPTKFVIWLALTFYPLPLGRGNHLGTILVLRLAVQPTPPLVVPRRREA